MRFLIVLACATALFGQSGQITQSASGSSSPATVTQSGSSTARNISTKVLETVSVKDFGAKGDGSTDDTAAFQAAHDSSTVGIQINIPPGTYIISSTINISKDNTHFVGSGFGVSILKAASGTLAKVFNVANSTNAQVVNVAFENLSVDMTADMNTTGTAFYLNPTRELRMANFGITGAGIGVSMNHLAGTPDSDAAHISHFKIEYPKDGANSRGMIIDAGNGGNFHISDGEIGNLTQGVNDIGLEIKSGHGFQIFNLDIYGWGTGKLIDPGANQVVSFGQINALQVDTSTGDGLRIDGTAAFASGYPYGVYNLQFSTLWAASNGLVNSTVGNGVNIVSARSISATNSTILSNSGRGVYVQSGTQDIYFDAGVIEGNSVNTATLTSNSGTYSGVEVANGTNSFGFRNLKSGQGSYYSNNQKYGLLVGTGCSYYHLTNNQLVNNITAAIQDNSRSINATIAGNIPQGNYVSPPTTGTASNTDLAGKLTLASGTATYTFLTAGLSSAPACVADSATANRAYISAISTTSFTVVGNGSDVVTYVCAIRN